MHGWQLLNDERFESLPIAGNCTRHVSSLPAAAKVIWGEVMMGLRSGIGGLPMISFTALPFDSVKAQNAQFKALDQKMVKAYRNGGCATAIRHPKHAPAIAI